MRQRAATLGIVMRECNVRIRYKSLYKKYGKLELSGVLALTVAAYTIHMEIEEQTRQTTQAAPLAEVFMRP